ncbi:hypothetical protein N7510_011395 [Penicillium lagena]|uniref:uncharacterized protein n=1 Tax=Penicillium lagena TaxID=94218 RepID=UPI002541C0AE|nr:uncharacterized protein N7510_011395 [Penicillium lagena]KAJ5601861.1 hypothetical protein N7510_011395 [Penicillium lagena]
MAAHVNLSATRGPGCNHGAWEHDIRLFADHDGDAGATVRDDVGSGKMACHQGREFWFLRKTRKWAFSHHPDQQSPLLSAV